MSAIKTIAICMAIWYFVISILTILGMVIKNRAHPVDVVIGFVVGPLLSALFLMAFFL